MPNVNYQRNKKEESDGGQQQLSRERKPIQAQSWGESLQKGGGVVLRLGSEDEISQMYRSFPRVVSRGL